MNNSLKLKNKKKGTPCLQPYKFGGKEYDEMHGLNWSDFIARFYSGIIPAFMTMDTLAEKDYSASPYAYCRNNPMRYVDPTGMELLLFKNGVYVDSQDDVKKEVTGYNQRSTINKDGSEEFTGADRFSFNDIELDRASLESKDMTLNFMSQDQIKDIIDDSEVNKTNVFNRWSYAAVESNDLNERGKGNMDYKKYLPGTLAETMYVIKGVGYNAPDAGNYLWGYGMGAMGFTSIMDRTGTHLNAWWSAKESNGERSSNSNAILRWFENRSWTGDSAADQRAIQRGLNDSGSYWKSKRNSIKRLWK